MVVPSTQILFITLPCLFEVHATSGFMIIPSTPFLLITLPCLFEVHVECGFHLWLHCCQELVNLNQRLRDDVYYTSWIIGIFYMLDTVAIILWAIWSNLHYPDRGAEHNLKIILANKLKMFAFEENFPFNIIVWSLNSFPPSAAYMRQWTGSALVQVMACRLFGAKSFTWTNAGLLSIALLGTNLGKSESELCNFH